MAEAPRLNGRTAVAPNQRGARGSAARTRHKPLHTRTPGRPPFRPSGLWDRDHPPAPQPALEPSSNIIKEHARRTHRAPPFPETRTKWSDQMSCLPAEVPGDSHSAPSPAVPRGISPPFINGLRSLDSAPFTTPVARPLTLHARSPTLSSRLVNIKRLKAPLTTIFPSQSTNY